MLIVLFGAAALAALTSAAWSLARLWRSLPRHNRDLVLF